MSSSYIDSTGLFTAVYAAHTPITKYAISTPFYPEVDFTPQVTVSQYPPTPMEALDLIAELTREKKELEKQLEVYKKVFNKMKKVLKTLAEE